MEERQYGRRSSSWPARHSSRLGQVGKDYPWIAVDCAKLTDDSIPLTLLTSLAGSVLVQTEDGHALLDPYTTLLGPGIPLPWKIKCVKPPLKVPYDGVPSEATSPPSKKRRKAARELSQIEQANLDLHEELRKWLPDAIEQVRQQWTGTSATRWYSEDRLVWSSNDENQVEKTSVDLVAWEREVSEINALQGKADVSEDGHIHLSGELHMSPWQLTLMI